jgi:hypothetical protein
LILFSIKLQNKYLQIRVRKMCRICSDSGEETRRLYLCKFISSKECLAALWSTVKLTTDQCWSHKGVHLGAEETLVILIDLVSLSSSKERGCIY